MAESLPYLVSPGSITKVLEAIRNAATPDKVNYDWVNAKAGVAGGTGRAVPPFLKKIGFLGTDGSPTDLYKKFRNAGTSKSAMASAVKIGYAALYEHHEYAHDLDDEHLKGAMVQITGASEDSKSLSLMLSCYKVLKSMADFESNGHFPGKNGEEPTGSNGAPSENPPEESRPTGNLPPTKLKLGLSYTINLNLPSTPDPAVYSAIFKALREHMINE